MAGRKLLVLEVGEDDESLLGAPIVAAVARDVGLATADVVLVGTGTTLLGTGSHLGGIFLLVHTIAY